MPPRLAELLERIRPAGAPGAPTEGERQREQYDQAREIADIAVLLAAFEEDANALITAATARATALSSDADRQARQIRAAVPDRVASAQSAAVRGFHEQHEAEQRQVEDRTSVEVARLKAQAASQIPSLVAAATEVVRSIVDVEPVTGDRP